MIEQKAEIKPAAKGVAVGPAMDIVDADAPLALYTVMIQRDAHTRVPVQLHGYEIPVLLEIWGEDNVFVVDQDEGQKPDGFDVERAFDGLRTKYRRFPDQLRAVYPSLNRFASIVGVRPTGTATAGGRDRRSLQKVRRPAKG